jgi:hypothetical protein
LSSNNCFSFLFLEIVSLFHFLSALLPLSCARFSFCPHVRPHFLLSLSLSLST